MQKVLWYYQWCQTIRLSVKKYMSSTLVVLRETAETIFRQALADCSVEQAFAREVKTATGEHGNKVLCFGKEAVELDRVKHIRIIAVGKASAAMLSALISRLQLDSSCDVAGILIAREIPSQTPPGFQCFAGGHPLPNEASFAGARAALAMLNALREEESRARDTLCFFLISGGASAMMELPLDPTISFADTVAFHDALVHSGASIAEINCVRKHFSAVKGGRLAMAAKGIPSVSLLVSDVPPGNLDALGSGPTLPDTSTVDQCREIIARYPGLHQFPASVQRFFALPGLEETPKPEEVTARFLTLLSADDLAEAAQKRANDLGFHTVIDNTCDDWDYRAAADYLLGRLRILRREHRRVCLISSGEVTVELPGANTDRCGEQQATRFGIGGRNQHFALYAATLLDASDASTVVFSAGSDGIDGHSQAAGAIVDDQTLQRIDSRANARRALDQFDSFPFLDDLGATIMTGPTGNNLRDLRILLADLAS